MKTNMRSIIKQTGMTLGLAGVLVGGSVAYAAATIPAACSTPGTCTDITSTFQAVASKTKMQFLGSNGTNFVALQAPAGQAADVTLTLPATAGNDGEVLKTDGSGNLDWVEAGGLRGKPVANQAALVALNAKDFEKRVLLDNKKEYFFRTTANLTAGEAADTANISDGAGSGKWVYQAPMIAQPLRELVGELHGNTISGQLFVPIMGGMTGQDLADKYERLELEFIITGFGTEYRAFETVATDTMIGTRNSLWVAGSSTSNKFLQFNIPLATDTNFKLGGVAMTANDMKVYGVKKQYVTVNQNNISVDKTGLVDGDLLKYDATNDKLVKAPATVPAGYEIIQITGTMPALNGNVNYNVPIPAGKEIAMYTLMVQLGNASLINPAYYSTTEFGTRTFQVNANTMNINTTELNVAGKPFKMFITLINQ